MRPFGDQTGGSFSAPSRYEVGETDVCVCVWRARDALCLAVRRAVPRAVFFFREASPLERGENPRRPPAQLPIIDDAAWLVSA